MPEAACIACGARVECVLDLGKVPLADALYDTRQASLTARRFSLQVGRCEACDWVQLLQVPAREILFDADYPYFSSVSESVCRSAERHAKEIIKQRRLDTNSFVMEIASNDGYQLQWFQMAGIHVLGIDPAPRQVARAIARGVTSRTAFFDAQLAEELRRESGPADVVLAKNVLAHVTDPGGFLKGIRGLLKPGGIASIEFPYLGKLLALGQFDTIYHEHASYLSIRALDRLLRQCDLGIESIKSVDLHGGSVRLDVRPGFDPENPCRLAWLQKEKESGINSREAWVGFADRYDRQREAISSALDQLRREGLRIAAYGAAAKGVTLMNVCQLDYQDVEFVVDKNEFKVGKFMAGTGLEVRPVEDLKQSAPDVVLLLAWNHIEEIRRQQSDYESAGGRFLVPIPHPELIGKTH